MASTVQTEIVDDEGLAELLAPRDDLVLEEPLGEGRFGLDTGPFRHYSREVDAVPLGDGRHQVTQRFDFALAIPVWSWLFVLPVKAALRNPPAEGHVPWWSPPDRMDARVSSVLGLLSALSIVTGYQLTLLSQTITFAADEFDASDTAQGFTLAAVRLGVVASLVLVALADRRGRRRMLLASMLLGCVTAAATALVPDLASYGVVQTLTRGLGTTAAVLLGIVAVEEMPANSRAYAVSVMSMAGALGGGIVLVSLPLADLGEQGWRLLFLLALPLMAGVIALGRRLPESRRFLRAAESDVDDVASHEPAARRSHRRRLLVLGLSGLFLTLFTTPASQFFNEFLRDERQFSATQITVFQILTNLPGGLGIVIGGRLADTKGRRLVGSVGLIGGVGATVIMYNVFGWPMWFWSVFGALVGAAVVPALGVYGPELFPTNMRGKANSILTVLGVTGSVTGLALAGLLSDTLDGLGPAMVVLSIGPAVAAAMVLGLYPETAHRELEELNPEDALLLGPAGESDGARRDSSRSSRYDRST